MKRREFVKTTAVATGLVAAGCGNDVRPAPILPTPLTAVNGVLKIPLKTSDNRDVYPDLAPEGGAITIPIAHPLPPGAPDNLLLIHASTVPGDKLQYAALKSACPHAGCPLGWSPKDHLVECPCHGSQFTLDVDSNQCAVIAVAHPPSQSGPPIYRTTYDPVLETVSVSFEQPMPFKVSFADHPELANPGGVALVQNPTACATVIVVRTDASTVTALSAICPHQDCTVEHVGNGLRCPCHGSQFDLNGGLLLGPAESGLPMIKAVLQADGIVIG